ncbi:aldehyde dehydrogenase family protein [Paenibacillus sp. HB172176]|uniref:aldehyde dehydrogenase family protein n=1 Tax=Paenibacillus sp. HB172176 TaxID=2493690 RepID=UPI00143A2675|nr:aldehyde dehydrogenase family protein [Paenibacillus sp. HB172176]
MEPTKLWINDEWLDADQSVPLYNPHTEEQIAEIGYASATQAELAIAAAARAFAVNRNKPAYERAAVLSRVADLFRERHEEAAQLVAKEAAKPIRAARGEIDRTIETYQLSAEAAKNVYGQVIPMDAVPGGEKNTAYTAREPLGVVAAITPFNFPMNLVAHKVGPAIAAGNTIVLKPAEKTPLSALFLAELFREAGLPAGVLNIIPGYGEELSEILTTHEQVAFITFTGSPRVGKLIRSQAGLRRVTLELGSNSPLLIDEGFSDQELDRIADQAITGAFSYNGQICISIQRIYVHENVYDDFIDRMAIKAQQLKIGDPLEEDTDICSLITHEAAERLKTWLEQAIQGGSKIRSGGIFINHVMHPTILTNVPLDAELNRDEAFGPIVTISPFKSWSEAIDLANDSQFGLNAGAFTKDIQRAFAAAKGIKSGAVLINQIPTFRVDQMPYGGVKNSGSGREGVRYAMEDMMETKLVSFRTGVYDEE